MDVYQWHREHGESTKRPNYPPSPTEVTTADVRWQGALVPMWIEPMLVVNTIYFAFAPVGASPASAFIVGEDASRGDDFGNDNPDADAFGFRDQGALRPFRPYARNYRGVADLVANIERGWYGRLDLQAGERADGYHSTFYASTGRALRDYQDGMTLMGMIMSVDSHLLREADYDPPLPAPPWCDPSEAPALLARLDNDNSPVSIRQRCPVCRGIVCKRECVYPNSGQSPSFEKPSASTTRP